MIALWENGHRATSVLLLCCRFQLVAVFNGHNRVPFAPDHLDGQLRSTAGSKLFLQRRQVANEAPAIRIRAADRSKKSWISLDHSLELRQKPVRTSLHEVPCSVQGLGQVLPIVGHQLHVLAVVLGEFEQSIRSHVSHQEGTQERELRDLRE